MGRRLQCILLAILSLVILHLLRLDLKSPVLPQVENLQKILANTSSSTVRSFFISSSHSTSRKNETKKEQQQKHSFKIPPVDCNQIQDDNDTHIGIHKFPNHGNAQAVIDYPWWANGRARDGVIDIDDELTNHIFQDILPNEIFIDVGANIGQMTMRGLVANKTTYAFDPLSFDIKKLCTGLYENLKRGWATSESASNLYIFHGLVGNQSKANITIWRPEEKFGKFEQASIFSQTVGLVRKPKLIPEHVPMVTLDEIVPPDTPVGLVKIDVQGFELPVVQGMKGLLERKVGYPKYIHYEEQARITRMAGFQTGTVQKLIESYGYNCTRIDRNDITCVKNPRQQESVLSTK